MASLRALLWPTQLSVPGPNRRSLLLPYRHDVIGSRRSLQSTLDLLQLHQDCYERVRFKYSPSADAASYGLLLDRATLNVAFEVPVAVATDVALVPLFDCLSCLFEKVTHGNARFSDNRWS